MAPYRLNCPPCMQVLMSHGLAAAHAADFHMHADRMSLQLRAIFQQGFGVDPETLAGAHAAQHDARRFLETMFAPPPVPPHSRPAGRPGDSVAGGDAGWFHVALSLPVLGVAPQRDEGTGSPRPASLWSLAGAPALAVPWGVTAEGLPVAVQLSAAHGADRQLLLLAGIIHAARLDV